MTVPTTIPGIIKAMVANSRLVRRRRREGTLMVYQPKMCAACGAQYEPTMPRQKFCPPCSKDRPRQYHLEHREERNERARQRYAANKEAHNERSRKNYLANREAVLKRTGEYQRQPEVKARARELYLLNADARRARRKEIYGENRDAHLEYQFKWRQAQKRAEEEKRLRNLESQRKWRLEHPDYKRRQRAKGGK